MRKLKLFFACLLMAVLSIGQMWASSPATITFSSLGLSNGVQYTDPFAIDNNVSITFGGGGNDGKYYTTGSGIRTYGGGYFTVAASNEGTIVEVACTWAGDSYKPSSDVANPTGYSTSTGKWTGSASSVTFSRPSGSGHWRLQGVTVTYTIPGGKDPAGLAYDVADQKQLAKLGEAFTAPTLSNDNNLTISYESDNTDVAEVANDGSITIKAAGKAVITASTEGDATHSDGSASYTICVVNHLGTEADPFDVADARRVIDAFGTKEGVYMSGIVSQITTPYDETYHNISFDISIDGTPTADQVRAYRCKGLDNTDFTSEDDVKTGATVTVYGNLKKYNSTYEFDAGCYLKAYEAPAVPKTHIANTKETAYTVAQALVYAADGATYDLDDYVYISGVVYDVQNFNNGKLSIFIKDADAENQFELYNCAGINDGSATTPFESINDVKVGNVVIGYGQMMYYQQGDIYEFKAGNYLAELQKPITGVWISELSAEVEAGATYTLTANVLPTNATGTIDWTVESGDAYASVADGVVTGIAEGVATIRATAHGTEFYKECNVTVVVPAAPKYTVRFWNSENWDNVKAHVWNNNGAITSWPGEDAQLGDDGWNYYEIEEGNSLLFNNGNGIQTVDITNVTADACYVLTGSADGQGHKYVEADCSDRFYVAGTTALTGKYWDAAGIRMENGSVTFYNVAASDDLQFKITNGTWKWNRGANVFDGECSNITNSGTDNVGFATDAPKDITISYNKVMDKICVIVADPAAPDDRYKAEQTGFTAISGKLATVTEGTHQGKEYISYEAKQGTAGTAPAINSYDEIRLYQNGGLLVIGAAKGCKIDQVFLTTGSSYTSTTIGYSTTETEIATTGDAVGKGADWNTASGLNTDTVVIVCLGTTNKQRIDVAKLDVRYTGEPAAPHHYKLVGEYATVFNQGDAFNHDNLIVYASYDELEEDLVDITAECSFSAPNMNQVGEQTIEITYNNEVVTSYVITINATATAKLKFFAPVAWEVVNAYTWEGTNTGNHEMTLVEEGSRWFECELEKGVPFLIHNGDNWGGLNQTADIAALDANKCYAWSTSTDNEGKINAIEIADCEMNYYIAGENLPEINWNADSKVLTNNAVEFEALAAGSYQFKITNGTWDWSLGFAYADQQNSNITLADNNGNVQFTTTAAMNVTIAYNPATEKITVNGVLPPKPFEPNIKFGTNDVKINSVSVNASDEYNNSWHIVTVPGSAGQSFTQSAEYSQVGSGSKPAESITFSTTLANNDEIAKISYIAIKLGGYNGTVGDVNIQVDGAIYEVGTLDGANDVVIATTGTDPIMGQEISIEISNIDKGVKCYGIQYAYQKYELVALKFFAPRDQTNKWDNVYAYAYDPANNAAYVAWPGEELTVKDAEFYVYNAPKGYNVIFHDYAGMQTNDIENVQETACYVPTAIDYQTKKVTLVAQCYVDYYVAGEEGFTGNNWDPANAACKFDENNQVVFHDVPAGSYEFKITNGSWAWSIGGEGFLSEEPGCGTIATEKGIGNTAFTIDEVQDVTITYYPETRKICLGAITVKTPGELTAYDIELYVGEQKNPSFNTNISDFTAADVTLTFVSGDECVEFVEGQIKGTAEGTAVVKVTIDETALFTSAEATFNVTVSAVPVPPTPQYETVRGGLEANRYYTICFNRTMEAVQGATFWTFASKDANMAYLVQEDAPYAAGKPYIIYAEAAGDLTAVLSGEEEPNAGSNGALHGTFSLMDQDALDGKGENIYLLMNNQLRRVDGQLGNSLPAYRAYIALDEIANTGAPANVPAHRVRAIPMHKDVVTGFENVNATDKPVKLLIDGNIYILRGEKMYNINGQLVK